MRRTALLVAATLTLAGCGSSADKAGTATPSLNSAPSSSAPALTAAETDYLLAIRDSELLGDYEGAELIALASAFCEDLRAERDPFASGESTGEGSFVFEQVSEPVLAMDAIQVEFEARRYLCPNTR